MTKREMPLRRVSLVDQLVRTIQHELITGKYPVGTAFVEEDVKNRYNVSRSTTREALVRLEEDRFLSRDAGTRTLRFRTLTKDEIRDVYYARRFYEGAGINHAKHATDEQLGEISESAEALCIPLIRSQCPSVHQNDRNKGHNVLNQPAALSAPVSPPA